MFDCIVWTIGWDMQTFETKFGLPVGRVYAFLPPALILRARCLEEVFSPRMLASILIFTLYD